MVGLGNSRHLSPLLITSVVFSIICNFPEQIETSRILFMLPLATQSETNLFIPIAKELALKGHDITFVSPVHTNLKIASFRELVPVKAFDMSDFDNRASDPIESRAGMKNPLAWLSFDFSFLFNACHAVYQNPEFQKIYKDPGEKFDLLFFSGNFNHCFEGLVARFKAPFVTFISMPVSGDVARMVGLRMPSSFVPVAFLEFTDTMSFSERLHDALLDWLFSALYHYQMAPEYTELYRKYLGADVPDMIQIEKNISLIFSNSHFSVNSPRPVLPDIVEIGGIHCKDAQPLPKDLETWLSEAKDGFIYFSFGSVVKGVTLPEQTKRMFLNVFAKLKQRVLWKYEGDDMKDVPSNVKLGKWLPQQDILGHKNIKLFISHGGLLSTYESAYHGVPVLGIPFFVDQDVNLKQIQGKGISIMLEILELTEDKLENTIKELLQNGKYGQRAKELSAIVRDRPQSPLETAIYWTEYILKHKGAPHLRSAARDLNTMQYFSIDVVLFLASALFITIFIIMKLFSICCCRSRNNKNSSDVKRTKKLQ